MPWLDTAAVGAMAAIVVLDVLAPAAAPAASMSGLAGLLALIRARHWGARHCRAQPLLWILHAGYAWMVLGLVLRAAALVGVGSASLATHALTVGAVGSLTLGMMARVALGHTGRRLVASRFMGAAFVGVNLAAAARVFGPLLGPSSYWAWLVVAGVLWVAAFGCFLFVSAPILSAPRVDGKAG